MFLDMDCYGNVDHFSTTTCDICSIWEDLSHAITRQDAAYSKEMMEHYLLDRQICVTIGSSVLAIIVIEKEGVFWRLKQCMSKRSVKYH